MASIPHRESISRDGSVLAQYDAVCCSCRRRYLAMRVTIGGIGLFNLAIWVWLSVLSTTHACVGRLPVVFELGPAVSLKPSCHSNTCWGDGALQYRTVSISHLHQHLTNV